MKEVRDLNILRLLPQPWGPVGYDVRIKLNFSTYDSLTELESESLSISNITFHE